VVHPIGKWVVLISWTTRGYSSMNSPLPTGCVTYIRSSDTYLG